MNVEVKFVVCDLQGDPRMGTTKTTKNTADVSGQGYRAMDTEANG